MSEKNQAELLAQWLESPPGTPAPDELDQDVIESIYALNPERSEMPTLDLDTLWDQSRSPQSPTIASPEGELISLPSRQWRRWIGGGTITAIATAATILFIARQVPMTPIQGTSPLHEAPSSEEALLPLDNDETHTPVAEAAAPIPAAPMEQPNAKPTPAAPPSARPSAKKQEAILKTAAPAKATASHFENTGNSPPEMLSTQDLGSAGSTAGHKEGQSMGLRSSQMQTLKSIDFENATEEDQPSAELTVSLENDSLQHSIRTVEKASSSKPPPPQNKSKRSREPKTVSRMAAEPEAEEEDSDEFQSIRNRAKSQAGLLLGQAPLDESSRALLLKATDYAKTQQGPSPIPELQALAQSPTTHSALKPQLWFLLGEIYLSLGQQPLALEAYYHALGR